jgi:hypothetical protein
MARTARGFLPEALRNKVGTRRFFIRPPLCYYRLPDAPALLYLTSKDCETTTACSLVNVHPRDTSLEGRRWEIEERLAI